MLCMSVFEQPGGPFLWEKDPGEVMEEGLNTLEMGIRVKFLNHPFPYFVSLDDFGEVRNYVG